VKLATTLFVSGLATNRNLSAVDPAPITSETTEPVGPVATATPDNVSDAAMIEAPTTHLVRFFNMSPPFLRVFHSCRYLRFLGSLRHFLRRRRAWHTTGLGTGDLAARVGDRVGAGERSLR
jgi:hypothetical protein